MHITGETGEQRRTRAAGVTAALIRDASEVPTMNEYAAVYASLGLPLPPAEELRRHGLPVADVPPDA